MEITLNDFHHNRNNPKDFFTEEEIKRLFSTKPNPTSIKRPKLDMTTLNRSLEKTLDNNTTTQATQVNSSYPMYKTRLILSILSQVKQILKSRNSLLLSKGITWLTNELTNSLFYQSDQEYQTNRSSVQSTSKPKTPVTIDNYMTLKPQKRCNRKISLEESNKTTTYKKAMKINILNTTNQQNHNNKITKPKRNIVTPINHIVKNLKYQKYQTSSLVTESDSKEQTIHSTLSTIRNPISNFSVSSTEDSIKNINCPTFNIFAFENEVGAENTLSVISSYVFTSYGLYSILNFSKIDPFLRNLTMGYNRSNSYHNDLHAADVLQTSMIMLNYSNLPKIASLDSYDICALFLATICHDLKHPGVNNPFLIQTSDKIALRYNDKSPLENYHVAQMFKLIHSKNNCNIFSGLGKENYAKIRGRIIDCILITDMTHHNEMLSSLKTLIEKYKISKGSNTSKIFKLDNEKDISKMQQDFLNLVMHSSDISNPTKPFEVYSQWAELVTNEFYSQGDKEKELGMIVNPMMDREKTSLIQGQLGFIEYVIIPFFKPVIEIFPGLDFITVNINNNRNEYLRLKDVTQSKQSNQMC